VTIIDIDEETVVLVDEAIAALMNRDPAHRQQRRLGSPRSLRSHPVAKAAERTGTADKPARPTPVTLEAISTGSTARSKTILLPTRSARRPSLSVAIAPS
jgi:hypothetical protein